MSGDSEPGVLTYRLNVIPYVVVWIGFIFCRVRSLQIRIIGIYYQPRLSQIIPRLTFVFLIKAFRAPTPPRSPADIPSTSSMIKHVLLSTRIPPTAVVLFGSVQTLFKCSTHLNPFSSEKAVERGIVDIGGVLALNSAGYNTMQSSPR